MGRWLSIRRMRRDSGGSRSKSERPAVANTSRNGDAPLEVRMERHDGPDFRPRSRLSRGMRHQKARSCAGSARFLAICGVLLACTAGCLSPSRTAVRAAPSADRRQSDRFTALAAFLGRRFSLTNARPALVLCGSALPIGRSDSLRRDESGRDVVSAVSERRDCPDRLVRDPHLRPVTDSSTFLVVSSIVVHGDSAAIHAAVDGVQTSWSEEATLRRVSPTSPWYVTSMSQRDFIVE